MVESKRNIVNLSRTIRPYRGEMTLAMICAFLKQVSVIGAAAITSYIAGMALGRGEVSNLRLQIILLFVCILLRAAGEFGEMYFAHDVAFRVIRNFRLDIYNKLSEIAPAYTLRKQTGQIGQAFIADVEILELFLAHTFSSFLIAVFLTAIIMVALLFVNPILSLLVVLAACLLMAVPYKMGRKAEERGREVRESLSNSNVIMVESIQGIRELVMLDSSERRMREISRKMDHLYREQYRYGRLKGRQAMATQIICGLFIASVMVSAAWLVSSGRMDLVMYPVAVMLSTVILGPVLELTTVAQELGVVFAASNRVQDLLGEKPVIKDEGQLAAASDPTGIRFDHVSFAYDKEAEDVLRDVCFDVEAGETVVLVGHSGAGKSTCANLILRYWDPDSGTVRFNGTDIREYRMEALRQMVSAASQETYLFHISVADNIRMGKPGASDAEVKEAARKANADEFIRDLPQGYDTVTGERGFRLSGGQRQRVAIARTLLRDAPIVILDESVSNLDAENELYMQQILAEQLKDKTVVMIAHRLSTILSADRIIVLDNGSVADVGTHEDLYEHSEIYRNLIKNQMNN